MTTSVMPVPDGLSAVQSRIGTIQGTVDALSSGRFAALLALSNPSDGDWASTLASVESATSDVSDPSDADTSGLDTTTSDSTTTGATQAQTAVSQALSEVGVPYKWGGESTSGFDCSGLVQYAYGKAGVTLPRVAADQAKQGVAVTPANAQAGDLLFFGSPVDHVGIYLGNGQMVDAPHTGANVRTESVNLSTCTAIRRVTTDSGAAAATSNWASNLPAAGKPYAADIATAAAQTGVSPSLLAAVAWQESDFNASARSSAGALGIAQLMPATAAGLGVNALDPQQALVGAGKYLKDQLNTFGGNTSLALAAYNAGPGAVQRYGGIPPYAETQSYVKSVLAKQQQIGGTS
jgi:cell wall-associated NlpC family hydrolase